MNPRMLVGDIIAEGISALHPDITREEKQHWVATLLSQVDLPVESALRYPHEFSGGQRQRICIARALAVQPKLIICDEPTSALDVSVQAQIIELLKNLQQQQGLSYLLITHNLGVVAEMADQVAVMYQGKIVEHGAVEQVLYKPQNAYTQALLNAVPKLQTLQVA
jgi:ABC-type oligopeptide transport system ATPase subunit